MRIYKFDGNATASVRGMQHVAKLIQDNTSKIVVLSAPKDVTKHLGEVAASFFNRKHRGSTRQNNPTGIPVH